MVCFFFKQKTAYEMRISDWSSDVCSSDLRVLLTHPGVAQAAVVGVPDERMGEVGTAFVVPAAGHSLDGEAVRGWAAEQMAGFKAPRSVKLGRASCRERVRQYV